MDRLQVITTESTRLAEVLSAADPEARVPTCPEWSAADLLWHFTEVHDFWATILATGATSDDEVEAIEAAAVKRPDTVEAILGLRADATARLIAELTRLSDDEPRWTWWDPDQSVGFTRRMQTYEATMHRVDAELAAGVAITPITAEVAAGAVDHCADVMWGWKPDWAPYEALATVELQADDTGDSWLIEVGHWSGTGPESGREFDEPMAVRASGGQPTGTVRGTAQQLALWAWGRQNPGTGAVEITGEQRARQALGTLLDAGIQ